MGCQIAGLSPSSFNASRAFAIANSSIKAEGLVESSKVCRGPACLALAKYCRQSFADTPTSVKQTVKQQAAKMKTLLWRKPLAGGGIGGAAFIEVCSYNRPNSECESFIARLLE